MAFSDCQLVMEWKRLEGGGLELVFYHLHLGFKGYVLRITKQADEPLEDAGFRREPSISSWGFRLFHGIDELVPLLRIGDQAGNVIRFYRGTDRKGRQRIYSFSHAKSGEEAGRMMFVTLESFEVIRRQLDQVREG